jgi:hypothetical protein
VVSIRQLRARLTRDESGMGIVEILVSLMIFSIVAIGMSYSMLSMTRLTGDATARETATNLAAEEIDRVAALPDAFDVHDAVTPKQVVIDGITFSVATNTSWVGANGSTGDCGIGGGQLQYKRVRVLVTWEGMYLQNPVRADSALAPSTRINDPAAGTLLIHVHNEKGDGLQGVTVALAKTSGGLGVTDPIDPTDVDGCTFVLKAPPGTYNVTLSKAGYIDTGQNLLPTVQSVVVVAGAATPVSAQADLAYTSTNKFAANSARTVKLPTNLEITYFGAGAAGPFKEAATATRKLFPWSLGYQAVAGNPSTCAAVDPANWIETTTNEAGTRAGTSPAAPGGASNLPVPMGVADVVIPGTGTVYLQATPKDGTTGGNPGCDTLTDKLNFGSFTGGTTQTIALPYGEWTLTTGATAATTTTVVTTGVTVRDGVISLDASGYPLTGIVGGGTFASNTLILDPTMVKP